MAIEEGLVVSIGGDVSSLNDAINAAKARIAEAQDAIGGLNDVMKVAEWDKFSNGATYTKDVMKPLQAEISSTKTGIRLWTQELKSAEEELKRLSNAQSGTVAPTEAARSAQFALNRVVRDSHSLLYSTNRGIAELTYAIPNFISKVQLAAQETGSMSSALKIASSTIFSWGTLLMAGGTALAFWLRSHHEGKNAVDEHKKSLDDFNKSLEKAKEGAISTGLQLQAYIDIAKNGNLPLSQRNEALKEANKLMGEHGEKITLANAATEKITTQTQLFTEALIQQAITVKYADRIADLYIKQTDAINEQIKKRKELVDLRSKETPAAIPFNTGNIGPQNAAIDPNTIKAILKNDEVEKGRKGLVLIKNEIADIKTNLNNSTTEAARLFGILGTHEKGKKDKKYAVAKPKEKKIKLGPESQVEKIKLKLDIELDKKDVLGEIFRDAELDEIKRKLNILRATMGDLIKIIDTPIKGGVAEKAFQQLEKYKAENLFSRLTHDVQVLQANAEKKISDKGLPQWAKNSITQLDILNKKKLDGFKETLSNLKTITNELGKSFTGLFEDIFNGAPNALQSFAKSIQAMIVKLAAAAAAAALLNALLGGIGLSGGGSAASALGGFKGIFASFTGLNIPGHATGNFTVPSGYPNDSYLARLTSGETVLTQSQLKALRASGGNSGGGRLTTEISGNNLRIILDRADRSRSRGY